MGIQSRSTLSLNPAFSPACPLALPPPPAPPPLSPPPFPADQDMLLRSRLVVQGEQTQAVSSQSKEADGITAVPDPPAPEEEEPTQAEAEPEEGEEGAEPKADAAAEEKLPTAAKNPDEFPQKDGVIVELSALPGVRTPRWIPRWMCQGLMWPSIYCVYLHQC